MTLTANPAAFRGAPRKTGYGMMNSSLPASAGQMAATPMAKRTYEVAALRMDGSLHRSKHRTGDPAV